MLSDDLLAALRLLITRDSWRTSELPSEIDEPMLRLLDKADCIQFSRWGLGPGRRLEQIGPSFSFALWPSGRGTGPGSMTEFLKGPHHQIRVSENGRAELADSGRQTTDTIETDASTPTQDEPKANGYVASPADPSAYVPVSRILSEHTLPALGISKKQLNAIVENYAENRVRWTRPLGRDGKPRPIRRSVHLADWAAYVDRRTGTDDAGFPKQPQDDIAERTAAIRRQKCAEQ